MSILTPLAETLPSTVPFVGPEAQERAMGRRFDARLGANENLFGPSPKVLEAISEAASEAWMYGDPENYDLKAALADFHDISANNIAIGGGIDGLLADLVRLTVGPGDAVVTSAGAYPTFNYHVTGFGGTIHTVPYRDDFEDPQALVAQAATCRAKLIYIANPDNPMGTVHGPAAISEMIDAVPDGSLLILDEAYCELAPDDMALPLKPDDPRVIRMRTFSKAHGLAGMRVGYAIGPAELIKSFDKVRNHFGMSRVSQAAALAALNDSVWLDHVRREVERSRATIARIATVNGLRALPSATNFVAVDCGADGDFARAVLAGLINAGVFVRMPFVAPQDRCIRISCGPPEAMAPFEAALPKVLKALKGGDSA